MSGSGTGIVTPYNTHRAIDLDGAADCYTRAADLIGNADGFLGTFSVWFRIDGGNGTNRIILRDSATWVLCMIDAVNRVLVRCRAAGGAPALELMTSSTYLAGAGWRHLVASWDLTVPTAAIYIDGAVPPLNTNVAVAALINYATGIVNWGYGSTPINTFRWNGALSEGYFNFAEYVDLSVEANRWLFRHPNGQPPNIGADGSGPTGNQPIMYMVEEGGVMVNRGSGGAFVAVGAPALSADSPKDRWVASLNRGSRRRRVYAGG